MIELIKLYLGTFAIFLVIDFMWLSTMTNLFYKKQLGPLLASNPNLFAASVFYAIYIFGLLALVIIPAAEQNSLMKAIILGAIFGLACYATYDLTNQATLKHWPTIVGVVDIIWGIALSTVVSIGGFFLARWIGIGK